ncbi:hypothetical protein [Ponticoccus litoralis]|uniref:Two-component sensor histidine kinase n=1 Tax=Ponticoccus litoralis TaxID=422297 RepID=A0AAW9S724_9RHOB
MHRIRLAARVLLVIAAVHLVVMAGTGIVLLLNARTAIAREVLAAQDSAAILISGRRGASRGQPGQRPAGPARRHRPAPARPHPVSAVG